MICLIPAKSPVVIRFEVILIEFDGATVISYRCIEVALLSVGKTSIVIEISLSRLNLNRRREALDGFIEVAASIERDALIIVCVGVFWVDLDGSRIILNSGAKLTQFIISETTIE